MRIRVHYRTAVTWDERMGNTGMAYAGSYGNYCNDWCYLLSLSGKVGGTEGLESRWFDVLAKSEIARFGQVVHITWERGSIYFDSVKIY